VGANGDSTQTWLVWVNPQITTKEVTAVDAADTPPAPRTRRWGRSRNRAS
jgi:hypothetical protein